MSDDAIAVEDAPDVDPVGELTLAGEFAAPTLDQWRRLVAKVLKTDDDQPELLLATTLPDGIALKPLYTADDALPEAGLPGQAPFVRGRTAQSTRGGWDVRQRHVHPDAKVLNEQLLEDLDGGAGSVWVAVGDGTVPVDRIGDVLDGVHLDLATVALDGGAEQVAVAEAFLAYAGDRPGLLGSLGIDPLGQRARTGDDPGLDAVTAFANRCADALVIPVVADALPYHEAGATDAQELAVAVATGVAYVRAMDLPAERAFDQLEFRLAATDDQFSTIAKLRAARRLWSRVAELSGVTAGMRQHAVQSWTGLTRRDPYNNILRGAIAAFAAGVGGADAVTVLPFDAAIGLPDPLARRVARNTQALLVDESHVAAVIDPAGGSWYVEQLTEALAHKAWDLFTEIERNGGMARAGAFVADAIAAARAEHERLVADGTVKITGVTAFPAKDEKPLDREPAPRRVGGGLPRIRWAEPHEELS